MKCLVSEHKGIAFILPGVDAAIENLDIAESFIGKFFCSTSRGCIAFSVAIEDNLPVPGDFTFLCLEFLQ